MNPYDYSKPINLWLTSDSDKYQLLVQTLNKKVEQELKTYHGLVRFSPEEHEKALHSIVADLLVTYSSDPKRYLAFSRSKNWYSIDTRYQRKLFSFKPFVNIVDALTSLEYIVSTKGYNDKTGVNSRNSRMRATEKLMGLLQKQKLTTMDFYQLDDKECLILKTPKDSKGRADKIDYEDTTETNNMRNNLKQINENIGKQWIDLKITDEQYNNLQEQLSNGDADDKSPVDFICKSLYRVFNNGATKDPKFDKGGRFYGGWWLSIPSEYRSRIRINNKKTVELDYSAMHFYMMYAEKGLAIPVGDFYTVDDIDRKKAKLALNTALNASSKAKAISAIKKNQWPDKDKVEVTGILNKLLQKHKVISEFFFTGKGLELQFKDSQIAELVMLNMWDKHGIIALPVHDSFIVPAASIDDLKSEMLASLKSRGSEQLEHDFSKIHDDLANSAPSTFKFI